MLRIVTQPDEIITVSEASNFMRVDFPTSETAQIQAMITAARQWCETYLRRAIGIQTLELVLDGFPLVGSHGIILRPPVIAVTSVKYLDPDNVEQTLVLNTDYRLAMDSDPAEIRPVGAWPAVLYTANSVKVLFQAGYSDPGVSPLLSAALPSTIRLAMMLQISDLYHNREAQTERPLSENPTLERLLSTYRLQMGV